MKFNASSIEATPRIGNTGPNISDDITASEGVTFVITVGAGGGGETKILIGLLEFLSEDGNYNLYCLP